MMSAPVKPEVVHVRSTSFGSTTLVSFIALVLLPGVVFVADLVVKHVSVSILYIGIVAGFGLLLPHRRLTGLAIMCAVLTLTGYGLKYFHTTDPEQLGYAGFRLLNRSLTAGLLLLLVPMLRLVSARLHIGRDPDPTEDELTQRDDFEGLVRWAVPAALFGVAVILLTALAIMDLSIPRQFNIPIVYVVFIPIGALFDSRRLIWVLLVVLLGLCFGGYYMGPAPAAEPQPWWQLLLTNRLLAGGVMLVTTFTLDAWLVRRRRAFAERRPTSGSPTAAAH